MASFERLQHAQYDRIYLSPHMDDAAYSCSGRILQERAEGKHVLVVTVFGSGKPIDGDASGASFANYAERFDEELAAMRALDADLIWLNEPELLFRKKAATTLAKYYLPFLSAPETDVLRHLTATVARICEQYLAPDGELLCPLGVGFHPDHRLVFEVGHALSPSLQGTVRFYEDLPYGLADSLTMLRQRFMGDRSIQISPYRAARETNERLLRRLGRMRWPTAAYVFVYLSCLLALQTVYTWFGRISHDALPEGREHDISDVVDRKAEVMGLYVSQTAQFFDAEKLVDSLRRDGRFVERTWTFPQPAASSAAVPSDQRPLE